MRVDKVPPRISEIDISYLHQECFEKSISHSCLSLKSLKFYGRIDVIADGQRDTRGRLYTKRISPGRQVVGRRRRRLALADG